MFLEWKLDKSRPICPQICEQLSVIIASGEVNPDEKLMSVREVAVTAGVNPNTVQKAFEELERQGLIYSVRGSGWFVGQSLDTAKDTVNDLTQQKIEAFFSEMQKLGHTTEQVKDLVKEWNE
jgi:DNA-binding transcriptional regulator YhcF (GntR family)